MKDTKWYASVVTLSTRDDQNLSKFLSKGFEKLVYWNEYKTKSENKNKTIEYKYFLASNFNAINRLFVSIYLNRKTDAKRFNAWEYYLPKGIIDNYNVVINGKNKLPSNWFPYKTIYEEIRKLTTGPVVNITPIDVC